MIQTAAHGGIIGLFSCNKYSIEDQIALCHGPVTQPLARRKGRVKVEARTGLSLSLVLETERSTLSRWTASGSLVIEYTPTRTWPSVGVGCTACLAKARLATS
jgi:hypothetical protein